MRKYNNKTILFKPREEHHISKYRFSKLTNKSSNNKNRRRTNNICTLLKKKSIFIKNIATSLIENHNGIVPQERKKLEKLNGVGRKTINVFLSEFYKIPSIAVDTHVERVSKRLNLVKKNATVKEVEETLMKKLPKEQWIKAHHSFIFFGRYHCKAINPNCKDCQLKDICKYSKN